MEELAKYGSTGIAIGAFILILWVIRLFLDFINKANERNDKINDKFIVTIEANTAVTKETHDFLRNLNGSLRKVVKEKQGERS